MGRQFFIIAVFFACQHGALLPVYAQNDCNVPTMIPTLERIYEREAKFEAIQDSLNSCSPASMAPGFRGRAYRLKALSHYYLNQDEEYNESVLVLAEMGDGYILLENDPPFFNNDIIDQRRRLRRRERIRALFWAGGAVIAASAAVFAFTYEPPPKDLPGPPVDPDPPVESIP